MSFLTRLFSKAGPLSLQGMTDWHCHILPGVDDGIDTMEDALTVLRRYEEAGIGEVWLTPHIMEDIPNTTDELKTRFASLQNAYQGNLRLHLAAENMMDNLFAERLEAGDLLPIGNQGRMLLVETSYFNAPMRLYDTLERIKAKGYYPLLAHPERYNYIDSFDTYKKMYGMGVKFQVNLMSLCGHYGPAVKDKAMKLLNAGLVDRFGTDLHRPEHLDIISAIRLNPDIANLVSAKL